MKFWKKKQLLHGVDVYIVDYIVPTFGIRLVLRASAIALAAYFCFHGYLHALFLSVPVYVFSVGFNVVEIDKKKNTYYEYLNLFGLRIGEKGNLGKLRGIHLKDVLYSYVGRRGIKYGQSRDCYRVSLFGEGRFELILLYSYGATETIDRVLELQEKYGYPVWDTTHEQLIGTDPEFGNVG